MTTYTIITVASAFGAPVKGTDKGPAVIVRSLHLSPVVSVALPHEQKNGEKEYRSAQHLPEVKQVCTNLMHAIKQVILNGSRPVILHGDDSSVIGVGYGLCQSLQEPFGVVYGDAHGDLNTPETTMSGCLYGQGLAHLLGRGHPELLILNNNMPAIDPKHLIMIGQRNLDPGEIALIKEKNITVFTPQQVHDSFSSMIRQITSKFKKQGIKKIYLHIDQDVVDPCFSGASLCQEKGGINNAELYAILEQLQQHFQIITLSMGNYLPSLDTDKKTLRIITNVLKRIMRE